KYGVERRCVGVSVFTLAEVARVVIVEQVVVTRFTAGIDVDGVEVAHDVGDAILSGVRAIAVGSSAIGRITVGTTTIAVFGVPVIGARLRFRIFNLIQPASRIMRWHEWVGLGGIVEEDSVGVAKHDVVGAGAAINGLVEVIANRIGIGEALEI